MSAGYGSIWREEGDDRTGGSSHSAFDGDQNTAWRFVSESDGSKTLEVDFTSVYAASGLLLRHADVGRTSTLNNDLSNVTVSVSVKDVDGNWNDVNVDRTDHDTRRMLLDFDAGEVEIRGLRLTFAGLDANEEHGIYEVLAKDGRVVEAARLRSRRGLLEKSLDDGMSWMQFSPNPEQFQATAGRVLVLVESHISAQDLETWVPSGGGGDASRITLRVRDVVGGALLQRRTSVSFGWSSMARDVGSPVDAPVYSFSLADLRSGKIGFLAGDGTNDITFTIQAEDDDGNLSDSDSVHSGEQPASVRIPVVGLEKVIGGRTSSVNSDGALSPVAATLNRWRGAAVGGALTILVELHQGQSADELLLELGHGVGSITSSWNWDVQSGIGTLSLEGSSSASASDFRSVLGFLQLRSAVGVSDSYRRILVRPDISGSAFRKDFHVREVKVYVNDAPEKPAADLPEQLVDEDATVTYRVPAFTDDEDTELEYEAKLVVAGSEQALPGDWIEFDKDTRTFTFKPLATHVGSHTLRVRGTDSGGLSDYADFVVTVGEFNDVPIASSLVGQTVVEEATVTYQVPEFTDEETSTLTYTFEVVRVEDDGSETPVSVLEIQQWVKFDDDPVSADFRTFTFTPTLSSHAGKYKVRVTATDDGINGDSSTKKSAEDAFEVVVVAVNDPPKAPTAALANQKVVEEATVTYRVPAFTDEETSTLTYIFSVVRIEDDDSETPVSISDWVEFDVKPLSPTFRTFTFAPKKSSDAGRYKVTVVGKDAGIGGGDATKKSAIAEFMLTVGEFNDAPVASSLVGQTVVEDTPSTYEFDAFTDEEEDKASRSLAYTSFWAARDSAGRDIVDGDGEKTFMSLPKWIVFDGSARRFTFKPHRSWDAGGTRCGLWARTRALAATMPPRRAPLRSSCSTVGEFNDAPVASSLVGQTVVEDTTAPTSLMRLRTRRRTRLLAVLRTRLFGRRGIRLGGIS